MSWRRARSRTGAISAAAERCRDLGQQARDALEPLPESPQKRLFQELAETADHLGTGVLMLLLCSESVSMKPQALFETRELRLLEYLEENETPVLGIREGCWLNVDGNTGSVLGNNGAVLFQRNKSPQAIETGGRLDHLLGD